MSLIHAIRRNTPAAVTADGASGTVVDADRHGNLFQGPNWKQRAIMRGLGFRATVGALSTPLTGGGAGTVLDIDQPEFLISVPADTILVPLRFSVQAMFPLLAADSEEVDILLAVDRAQAWDGTGTTFVSETVYNMRTDRGTLGSVATVRSAFEGDITSAPVHHFDLDRAFAMGDVQSAVGTTETQLRVLYEPQDPEFIVGPAMVLAYWGGTVATTGFGQFAWLELPSGYAN